MSAEDILVTDIDSGHWEHLVELLAQGLAQGPGGDKEGEARSWLLMVHERGVLQKAYHSERGWRSSPPQEIDLGGLKELARSEKVSRLVLLEKGAAGRMLDRLSSRLNREQDLAVQVQEIYQAVEDAFASGDLAAYPAFEFKSLSLSAISGLTRLVSLANQSILLVVFDRNSRDLSGLPIFTSLVWRHGQNRNLDLLTTTAGLAKEGRLQIDDWKKDYKSIVGLAEKALGPVLLGVFTDLDFFRELGSIKPGEALKRLGEWSSQGRLIIDPFPLKLKILLKAGSIL